MGIFLIAVRHQNSPTDITAVRLAWIVLLIYGLASRFWSPPSLLDGRVACGAARGTGRQIGTVDILVDPYYHLWNLLAIKL